MKNNIKSNIISKKKFKSVLGLACLIFLASSMPFVQALTSPIPNQMIVKLDDSPSVLEAISTLKQNIPNAVVVDFDSAEYNLKYWRFLGVSIWVSHGDKQGVLIDGEIAQWNTLEDPVKGTLNKDIVLSCYSNELIKQTDLDSEQVLTFEGEIDAIFGSLVISYVLTQNSAIMPQITSRISKIRNGDSVLEPLVILLDPGAGGGGGSSTTDPLLDYAIYRLSWAELSYHLGSLILLVLLTAVDLYIPSNLPFVQTMALQLVAQPFLGVLMALVYFANGWSEFDSAIIDIFGWFVDSLEILHACFNAAAAWEKAIVGIALFMALFALCLELAADVATDGAITVAKFIVAAASFLMIAVDTVNDYNDLDRVVG